MFEREHHVRIATLLQSLNAELLNQDGCLFGGGTAIVLTRDEYRESLDIDFLVSERKGYQHLRQLLTGKGIQSIARDGMKLDSVREIRADQYGIRTMLRVGSIEIKFEIVFEARIQLEAPAVENKICGVSSLTRLDMAATKLLANSDRWADDSVYSRDLIDLAMIGSSSKELLLAVEKASGAYGESIVRDLNKAIDTLAHRKGRLDECMEALKITVPKAVVWKNIRSLRVRN